MAPRAAQIASVQHTLYVDRPLPMTGWSNGLPPPPMMGGRPPPLGRLGSVAVVCGNSVLTSVGVALGGGGAVVVESTDDGVGVDVEVDVEVDVSGTEVERGDVVVVVVPAVLVDVDNVDGVVWVVVCAGGSVAVVDDCVVVRAGTVTVTVVDEGATMMPGQRVAIRSPRKATPNRVSRLTSTPLQAASILASALSSPLVHLDEHKEPPVKSRTKHPCIGWL